jgi:hypothetical protein
MRAPKSRLLRSTTKKCDNATDFGVSKPGHEHRYFRRPAAIVLQVPFLRRAGLNYQQTKRKPSLRNSQS